MRLAALALLLLAVPVVAQTDPVEHLAAALGLDAEQSARLDTVLEEMRDGSGRGLRDGTVPDAVAAILTPEQVEVYRAQRALQMHLRRSRFRGAEGTR